MSATNDARNFYRLDSGVILVYSSQAVRDADQRGVPISNEMFKAITHSFAVGRARRYGMEFVR